MFWSSSLGPTWSDWFQSLNPFIEKPEQKIFSKSLETKHLRQIPPNGIHMVRLVERDAKQIQSLLNTHFQLQRRCRFMISTDRVRPGLKNGWLGIGLRDLEGDLVGCVFSKPVKDAKTTGVVDFFCVAPRWRKKRLASYMLQEILRYTMEEKRYIHYFLKEGYPLFVLPPLYTSRYLYRLKNESYHHSIKPSIIFGNIHSDSQIYTYTEGIYEIKVCVVDHFHRSVPEGWKIGELFWIQWNETPPLEIQKRAVETVVDFCDYSLVLMDSRTPHDTCYKWKRDSAYSWYIFNYHPGTFYTQKPMFHF